MKKISYLLTLILCLSFISCQDSALKRYKWLEGTWEAYDHEYDMWGKVIIDKSIYKVVSSNWNSDMSEIDTAEEKPIMIAKVYNYALDEDILALDTTNGYIGINPKDKTIFITLGEGYALTLRQTRGYLVEEKRKNAPKSGTPENILSERVFKKMSEKYDDIGNFFFGLARVQKNGLYGYINTKGKEIIEVQYTNATLFQDYYAFVANSNSKWGIIDNKGALVVPHKYDNKVDLTQVIIVSESGRWGLIHRNGDVIVRPQYDKISYLTPNVLLTRIGKFYGLLSYSGEELIKPKYTEIDRLTDKLFKVEYYSQYYGIVDNNGRELIEPKYLYISEFTDGLSRVYISDKNGHGLINEECVEILPPSYNSIGEFKDGLARVCRIDSDKGNQWGFINTSGEEVIPSKYKELHEFSEGFAAFRSDNFEWGFIDKMNNIVIKPQYYTVEDFANGYAKVRVDDYYNSWGLIDATGKLVLEPSFSDINEVQNGFVGVAQYNYRSSFKQWGFFKIPEGIQITPIKYSEVKNFTEGYAAVRLVIPHEIFGSANKWGYINEQGEEIIPFRYYYANPFENGLAKVSESIMEEYVYIDKSGNIVR